MSTEYVFRDNASSFESYQRHVDRVNDLQNARIEKMNEDLNVKQHFPYKSENLVEISKTAEQAVNDAQETNRGDRGFFRNRRSHRRGPSEARPERWTCLPRRKSAAHAATDRRTP